MRTSRSNGTKTYNYVYNGSQLTQMTVGNDTLYFTYGAIGPTTVTWNGTTYYYAVNAQGDVMGIFDASGTCVVTYNWDNAWGYNPEPEGTMASTLGTLNPLRYRSYVYDEETELYYLQSRYYNPEISRFINADNYPTTGQGLTGNNMFAYCGNNPVSRKDDGGEFWNIVIGAVVGAAISSATQIVSNLVTGQDWHHGVASAAVVGAVGGAVAATGLGAAAQAVWTGVAASAGDAIQQGIDKGFDKIDPVQSVRTGLVAGATSLIGSYAGKNLFGGIDDAGNALISKGHQKNLTGVMRALKGKSHTHYYRSGTSMIAKGKNLVNFYRGASSCLGSLIGISTGLANNLIPR